MNAKQIENTKVLLSQYMDTLNALKDARTITEEQILERRCAHRLLVILDLACEEMDKWRERAGKDIASAVRNADEVVAEERAAELVVLVVESSPSGKFNSWRAQNGIGPSPEVSPTGTPAINEEAQPLCCSLYRICTMLAKTLLNGWGFQHYATPGVDRAIMKANSEFLRAFCHMVPELEQINDLING